jgi:hypothetical protein
LYETDESVKERNKRLNYVSIRSARSI